MTTKEHRDTHKQKIIKYEKPRLLNIGDRSTDTSSCETGGGETKNCHTGGGANHTCRTGSSQI